MSNGYIVETEAPESNEWDGVEPGIVEIIQPAPFVMVVEIDVRGFPGPPGSGSGIDPTVYETRFHEVSKWLVYRAEALIGSPETAPVWRVQLIAISYGSTVTTTKIWANGNDGFVHKWSDHLDYTYEP